MQTTEQHLPPLKSLTLTLEEFYHLTDVGLCLSGLQNHRFYLQKYNSSAGCQWASTLHSHVTGSLVNAAGFMVRCLPMYETPEQLKNLLLNPQLEQKGQ